MEHKKAILRGGGFYAALALCVLAVGAGGYFLLFDRADGAEAEAPPQTEAAAPAPEITEPDAPAVVEAVAPEPVAETDTPEADTVPMPEAEIDDTPVTAAAPRLVVEPLEGEVVTAFSVDELVYSETLADWRTHDGVDITAAAGASVLAACSGTVTAVTDDALMGTTVVIDHADGYQTTYASLETQPAVEIGDSVSAGQIIGTVGTTASAESAQGPHLHFSVCKDGDAVAPDVFLKQ